MAAFIWSETLTALLSQGRVTLKAFSGASADNMWLVSVVHGGRHCSKNQQVNVTWREMWPSHRAAFKLAILKDLRGHGVEVPLLQAEHILHELYTLWAKLGDSIKGSLLFQEATNLILGLSQVMLSRCCTALCKALLPGPVLIQCISLESSSLVSDYIYTSTRLLSCPVNHPSCYAAITAK